MTSALAAHQAWTARAMSPSAGGVPERSSRPASAMYQRQSPRTTTCEPSAGAGTSGQSGTPAPSEAGDDGAGVAVAAGPAGQSGTPPAGAAAAAGTDSAVVAMPASGAATPRPSPSSTAAPRR